MKVELTREDWQEGLNGAISLLKNALCQVEVYQGQVDLAEKKIAEFPKPKEPPKKENPIVK